MDKTRGFGGNMVDLVSSCKIQVIIGNAIRLSDYSKRNDLFCRKRFTGVRSMFYWNNDRCRDNSLDEFFLLSLSNVVDTTFSLHPHPFYITRRLHYRRRYVSNEFRNLIIKKVNYHE